MESVLVSDYTVEVTRKFTPEYIAYIADICDARSSEIKEKGNNYTREKIYTYFNSGRFAHGFYIVKCKNVIVWTFGVDDFKGWGVISRMLRHNSSNALLPVVGAVAVPFVLNYLKDEIIGLCGTQNVDKRDLFDSGLARRERIARRTKQDPNNIFTAVARTKYVKLEYDVNYRNTRQQVYTIQTDKIPPFERF